MIKMTTKPFCSETYKIPKNKPLYEKKISELEEYPDDCGECGNSQAYYGPVIWPSNLKEWAIACVGNLKACDKDGYHEYRLVWKFLVDKFELTKDDLK